MGEKTAVLKKRFSVNHNLGYLQLVRTDGKPDQLSHSENFTNNQDCPRDQPIPKQQTQQ